MDYASTLGVWYMIEGVELPKKFESVQKCTARFVTGNYNTCSYHETMRLGV